MTNHGFEVTEDGLVILRPKPTDPFSTFVQDHLQSPPVEIKMSPEFVREMMVAVRKWEEDRFRKRRERTDVFTSSGIAVPDMFARKGRGATNIDPDGVERGWFVEDIWDD